MGWTSTHKSKNETVQQFFQNRWGNTCEILDSSVVNWSTFYAACRIKNEPWRVFAVICLIKFTRDKDGYNFTYKDLDETMGPCECHAPARILDLLTPTDNNHAIEWRSQCRANIAKRGKRVKLQKGDTVVFQNKVRFTNGEEIDTFEVMSSKPLRFCRGYGHYRIGSRHLADNNYRVIREGSVIFDKAAPAVVIDRGACDTEQQKVGQISLEFGEKAA